MNINSIFNPSTIQPPLTDNPYENYSDSAQIKHLENNFERFADPRHGKQFVTQQSLDDVANREKNTPEYNKNDADFAKKLSSSKELLSQLTDGKSPIQHDDGVFISKSDTQLFNSNKP